MIRLLTVVRVIGWLILSQADIMYAEPYRPTDDAQVLERLSYKATDPAAHEIERLRADLRNNPRHLESAVKLAARYIEQGRS
jgi:thioredoxin-like negative regulator of GroEL